MAEAAAPGTTATTSGAAAAAAVAAASPTFIPTVAVPSPGAGGGGGGGSDGGGGGGWTKQVTCRYFMHGVCKEGDNCRYSHDLSDSPYGVVCKYFQRGYCIYGDRCRYEHSKPLKQEAVTAADPSAKASLAASSSLPSGVGPLIEMNTSEAESRNPAFPTVGAGSEDWVNAVEFVPGQPYCGRSKYLFCEGVPYSTVNGMGDGSSGSSFHKSCIEAHEKDMELSFAVQRSKDMVCGICMEVVYEKANPSERRFGILSNCNHTYCLKCIRKWRSAKQFESKIIKSCPECRITSNFVIPSEYWVEEKEEKQKLIQKYKEAMSNKACRYFDEGRGSCPFGGNCFYKHAYPDGRREEPQRQKVGTSSRYRAQRRNHFWELIEERENSNPFDNDEEEVVTFELGEMLLMLLAAGGDDELTDSEDEWDLFHDELEDFYDLDL
uniref:RING-type E3 ubiquitin transferase n=1 Tax=Jaculus jaculus TaxID=51337 RepID=A0A8C5K9X7_JACJA